MPFGPITTNFKVGDRILYRLRTDHYLPGVVVNITPRRVVIMLDAHTGHVRNTLPSSLTREDRQ